MFFPIYLFALKAGLGVAGLVTIVLAVVSAALHGTLQSALESVSAYPGRALMVFAWTTLGFALLELMQARVRVVTNWDPRRLPKLKRHGPRFEVAHVVRLHLRLDRRDLVAGHLPFTVFADWAGCFARRVRTDLARRLPAARADCRRQCRVASDHVPAAVLDEAALVRAPGSRHPWLLVLAILIRARQYFVPVASVPNLPEPVNADQVVNILDMCFQIGFTVAAVIVFIQIVKELLRLKRATPMPPDSMAARATR